VRSGRVFGTDPNEIHTIITYGSGAMLKLRSIGLSDYSVLEGRQRIGRIRFADERMPGVWLWNATVHLTGGLPMGSANKAMNIRDDG
jgi:hypothetical protein